MKRPQRSWLTSPREPFNRSRICCDVSARLEDEAEHRIAAGLAADGSLRRKLDARPLADPRPIDEILAWDEHGLPM